MASQSCFKSQTRRMAGRNAAAGRKLAGLMHSTVVQAPVCIRCRGPVACRAGTNQHQDLEHQNGSSLLQARRGVLLSAAAAAAGAPALLLQATLAAPSWAEEEGAAAAPSSAVQLQTFSDSVDGFSLSVPSDWQLGEGQLQGNSSFTGASGSRRTIAFYPVGDLARDVNVTITITNTSTEFTKLGSFGNVYTFGSNLVASMDRSQLLRAPEWVKSKSGPVQVAKLLDAKEMQGNYFVEYTVQKPPEPTRHLSSVVALGNNGTYNRLYTVTAQCLDGEQLSTYGPLMQRIIASFVPPKTTA